MLTLLPPQRHNTFTKSELIAAYLQQMALPSMWHRILSESDYELWDTVLDPYSIPAIKFAFDSWVTGAKKFPAPADILPLCGSYAEQKAIVEHHKLKRVEAVMAVETSLALVPEVVTRAERFHAQGINPAPPLEEWEIPLLISQARQRQMSVLDGVARFPNGNPVYNRALTQARALLDVGRPA